MRIVQTIGKKGSLKWIQHVVNKRPDVLNIPINKYLGNDQKQSIEWLSPKKDDYYSEYRDQAFLDLLGVKLKKAKLKDFWPNRGPQWDALGKIGDKAYFLVEAKAHVSETISSSQTKSSASISHINKSLSETNNHFKPEQNLDHTKGFYQYSNRLAHLCIFRK